MVTRNIALVAHDSRKRELLEWAQYNLDVLKPHNLYATGTTGRLLESIEAEAEDGTITHPLAGHITRLLSGPTGGDQQIGAMIATGGIDVLIFFCDNLIVQGHQTDVSALTRLASLYNVAFAENRTTADMLVTSPLFTSDSYEMKKPDFSSYLNREIKK